MANSLALFDFDGTLTVRDSLADFIIYAVGLPKTLFGTFRLSSILMRHKMNWMDNGKAKEKVISHFFKGWSSESFSETGRRYAQERLPKILHPEAVERLQWHLDQEHEVVLVTASIEDWIISWSNDLNIELVATKVEIKEGVLSGKLATKNCYGKEKVRRIKQRYKLNNYETIYAYGDSNGDKPMLELADHPYYRPF